MECLKCNFITNVKCNWEKHLTSIKHNKTKEPFTCALCDYTTTVPQDIKNHMNSKLHQLLKKITPTNYMTIPLDTININDYTSGRGMILHQLKILNKKYKFCFIKGSTLFVYTTQWNKYNNIIEALKVIYQYFENYFIPKMEHQAKIDYYYALDNIEAVEKIMGKEQKQNKNGFPITRSEYLHDLLTITIKKRTVSESARIKSEEQKHKQFLISAGIKEIETDKDKENFKEFIEWMNEGNEWDEIYKPKCMIDVQVNLYNQYCQWYDLYCEGNVKPIETYKTLTDYCKVNKPLYKKKLNQSN